MPKVAIDSNVIIYFFDGTSEFQEKAYKVLSAGYRGTELTLSNLVFLELLAKPSFSEREAKELYEQSKRLPIHIEPITTDILLLAARLRRTNHSLKTPDAIHLASALAIGATQFITNDKLLLRTNIKGIEVLLL